MKITGIIAEYDPFHNGHAYHIGKARAAGADAVVVALGGEFTQRGEPAWCSKYLRAQCALLCGADLVLEIPLPYALGSAERFAEGGVSVLDALGCVDTLSFGSECGDAEKITRFAALSDSPEFLDEVKKAHSGGVSAASAREAAARFLAPELSEIAASPNDTLGTEYCKWLSRLGSSIEPFAVRRYGAGHGEAVLKSGIASATYLRSFPSVSDILPYVPAATHGLLLEAETAGKLPALPEKYGVAALSRLRTLSEAELARVPDCAAEGLYHRVFDAVRQAKSLDELYSLIKTKRYAMSRVKRIVAGAYLGLDGSVLKGAKLPYIRVLGMNDLGAAVLKEAKSTAKLPISASLAELERVSETAAVFAALEARAEDLWQILLPSPGECGLAYKTKLIKV